MKEVIEAATITHAGKISAGAGAGAAAASWTLGEIGALFSIFCALLGLIIPLAMSYYFQSKKDAREDMESKEKMRLLGESITQLKAKSVAGE